MGAPLPPEAAMPAPPMGADPMGAPMGADPMAAPPMPKAAEMVLMALQAMQAERDAENGAVLTAVMQATGGMQTGLAGVSEGAPMGVPAGPEPELGAY